MVGASSKDAAGSTRRVELDIAKFLAILFMIYVHAYGMMGHYLTTDLFYEPVFDFMIIYGGCMCAAMVFMFCMGVGLVYSHRTNRRHLLSRAAMMVVLGILINIAMHGIPWLYDGAQIGDVAELLISFFAADVYFSFALAFLCFIPIIESKNPRISCVIAMVAVLVLNTVLNRFEFSGGLMLDTVLGSLFRDCPDSAYSYFPIIPWMVFPLLGYLFGTYLKDPERDKGRLYLTWATVGAAIIVTFSAIQFLTGDTYSLFEICWTEDDPFYGMATDNVIWSMAHLMVWMLLMFGLSILLKGRRLPLVEFCSKNVMVIYFLQWVFIPLFIPVLEITESITGLMIISTVITVIVFATTYIYVGIRARMKAEA